ncbi:hypothetical protein P280DRAFT_268649 [Massarina eburnea CBS 473.64]|uniref:Transmembrane protein n=1 Tax=Massarina eburnea CBS 473.64 TaxID=1395130 RepID=A0A6A6S5R0_9PLEO|nr:hypothetical protein P280DRAFT_268649 [Massarina eburnea CBS 473.64]
MKSRQGTFERLRQAAGEASGGLSGCCIKQALLLLSLLLLLHHAVLPSTVCFADLTSLASRPFTVGPGMQLPRLSVIAAPGHVMPYRNNTESTRPMPPFSPAKQQTALVSCCRRLHEPNCREPPPLLLLDARTCASFRTAVHTASRSDDRRKQPQEERDMRHLQQWAQCDESRGSRPSSLKR